MKNLWCEKPKNLQHPSLTSTLNTENENDDNDHTFSMKGTAKPIKIQHLASQSVQIQN